MANKKVIFLPHGTYLISDTLKIPPGTRSVDPSLSQLKFPSTRLTHLSRRFYGEVWSEISAVGEKFADENTPTAVVQVGQPGDVGTAQFVDMLFTVADILPGAKLVEVNMAGAAAGDVGFWNSHFRSRLMMPIQ